MMNADVVITLSRSGDGKVVKFRVKGAIGDRGIRRDLDGDPGNLKVASVDCVIFFFWGHIDRQPRDNGVKFRLHDQHFGIVYKTR